MRWFFILLVLFNAAILLWQLTDDDASETEERRAEGNLALLSEQGDPGCYGSPQLDPEAAERLLGLLRAAHPQAQISSDESLVPLGVWIYLPPEASFEAAKQRVAQLQAAGIEGYAVVVGEELANAVSLGLFADPDAAREQADALRALDLQPQMERRFAPRLRITVEGIPAAPTVGEEWHPIHCQAPGD